MKGYKQKLGVLLLALVLALGGLGVSYAHWAQNLEIATTVNVGQGSPGFTEEYQFFQDPEDPVIDEYYDCTCYFSDSDGDGDLDTMEATMTDVADNCTYKLYSTISDNGTLPMRITDIEITEPDLVTIEEEETLVGAVLDPGDEVTCKLLIAIGEEATAGQYSFSVKITSCLWNQ